MWEMLNDWGLEHLIPIFTYYQLDPHCIAKDINVLSQYVHNSDELCALKSNFDSWYQRFNTGANEPYTSSNTLTDSPHADNKETNGEIVVNNDYSEIEGPLLIANSLIAPDCRDTVLNMPLNTHDNDPSSPVIDNNIINEILNIQQTMTNNNSTKNNEDTAEDSNIELNTSHNTNDSGAEEYIDDIEMDHTENNMNNPHGTNNPVNNTHSSISLPRVVTNDTPLMLYKFLSEDPDGRGIINAFENDTVTNKIRNLLVRCIFYREKEEFFKKIPPGKIPSEFKITPYEELAAEIQAVFPRETTSAYYIPHRHDRRQDSGPSGKFVAHYYYEVGVLRKQGLIGPLIPPDTENSSPVEPSDISDENLDAALSILKSSSDSPFTTVLKCWNDSFQYRRNLLMEKSFSVTDYFDTFPCLTANTGAQLIRADFKHIHLDKGSNTVQNWNVVKEKLKKLLLTTRQPKNVSNKALALSLQHIEKDDQDAVILHLLTTLINAPYIKCLSTDPSPAVPKKRKITKRRVSSLEARESIFLIAPNIGSVEKVIEERQEYLKKNGLPFQPIAVLVGELDKIVDAYVYIENKRYRTKKVFNAIDLTFKSFFALDCDYPEASCHLWTLLQKVIYNLDIAGEFNSPSLQILINDIANAEPLNN